MRSSLYGLLTIALPFAHARLKTCRARDLPAIKVPGVKIINLQATEHHNYTDWMPSPMVGIHAEHQPLDFCNLTVTYTHPGQGDSINVYIMLPFETWNGRYLGQGGGGWSAGFEMALMPSVAAGYAVSITDAGHTLYSSLEEMNDVTSWALTSPGNINWVQLQNFAAQALSDMPQIAKQVVKGFYGETAKKAYWSGCSTGGRQGLMSAQRFPEDYDGIVAAAPAINWDSFVTLESWSWVVMKRVGYYPPPCEFEAITAAAIEACDGLDGVMDGVVAAPGLCTFDAKSVIGKIFDCEGQARKVSAQAAEISNAIWAGPVRSDNGKQEWFGLTHETAFSLPEGTGGPRNGLVVTECDVNNENCRPRPFVISAGWIRDFVLRHENVSVTELQEDELWRALRRSRNEFASIMGTADADLTDFKKIGGKVIMWHGLADELIPPNGTSHYYERVLELDPHTSSFFRYFEAPGVQHCAGGPGAFPGQVLDTLVKWVEEGVVPNKLDAATMPKPGARTMHRPLCPYPLVAAYNGGDISVAASYECAESFDGARGHSEL